MKKYALIALTLVSTPAFAQAPTDAEIAVTWDRCKNFIVEGRLSKTVPWKPGAPSYCNDKLKSAYQKSKPAIDAKTSADAEAAADAKAADIVNRIPSK